MTGMKKKKLLMFRTIQYGTALFQEFNLLFFPTDRKNINTSSWTECIFSSILSSSQLQMNKESNDYSTFYLIKQAINKEITNHIFSQ